jgi:hypothetical protein
MNQAYNTQPHNGGYIIQPRNAKLANGRTLNNFNENKNQIKFIMSTSEGNCCTNHAERPAEYKIVIDG